MFQENRFKKLRSRAEKMLGDIRIQQNDSLNKEYIQELIRELTLYQIELELQDEDLRNSQRELKESQNKYAELYDFAPAGYFTLDSSGLIMEVNQAGAILLGVNKQILLNKNLARYVTPDFSNNYTRYIQQLDFTPVQTCELKIFSKSGPIFDAQLAGKRIKQLHTTKNELLIMMTDITALKKNEEWAHTYRQKVAHLDRIGTMGELTSAMAHEINQPLAVIGNYVHGCIRRLENGEMTPDLLLQTMRKTAEQLQRTSDIMLRMRNFVSKGIINHEPVCIDSVMQESLKLINYETLEYPVKVNYRSMTKPPIVMLDRIQIQQVILNLTRNSIEALKDTNTLDPSIHIELNQPSKAHVEISVHDNGPGIKQAIEHRLFDPHFTTKPYGVGLGLAVSRTIIEAHGGKLSVEPHVPYGACFKILLPVKQREQSSTFSL